MFNLIDVNIIHLDRYEQFCRHFSHAIMNGRTLYFIVIIMYDFLLLFFMLSRISFRVVVLVYRQTYTVHVLLGAFILSVCTGCAKKVTTLSTTSI